MGIIIGGNDISGNFDGDGFSQNTPNIITNGLVVWLDPGINSSYFSSGNYYDCGYGCQYYSYDPGCTNCNSQLKDLSGYGNDGNLSSASMISNNEYGKSLYNSTSNYVNIPYSSYMDFSAAQTICMWIKPGSGSTGGRRNLYDQAYGGSGTLTHEVATDISYYFGTNGGNSSPYVGVGSGFGVATGELAFITVTRSQSLNVTRWYKNGVLYTDTNAGSYASVTNSTNPIRLNIGYTGNYYLGDTYMVMVYNTYLTSEQVNQNFNATRFRFGI